jgi:cell division protein ZapA (FtsZ GTPase activity inhibitor)
MFTRTSASQLAARVRSLLGATDADASTLREAADSLGVHVGDLREIVQYETVYPSVVVLAAIVATYGVDAGWLLTGTYSPATHRASEEAAEPASAAVARALRDDEQQPPTTEEP